MRFYSAKSDQQISLKEYAGRMNDCQHVVYSTTGDGLTAVPPLPCIEDLRKKDSKVRYAVDSNDKCAGQQVKESDGKKFSRIRL